MDKLKILHGDPLQINELVIKNPKIIDILNFGEINFNLIIELFTFQLSDYAIEFDDLKKDYTKQDLYLTFISLCMDDNTYKTSNTSNQVSLCLNWLTGLSDWKIGIDNKQDLPFLYSGNYKIDKPVFFEIRKFLFILLMLEDREEIIPANKRMRDLYIEEKREKRKDYLRHKKNKNDSFLYNNISCLVWGNTCGITYDNVWNLTLLQFNDGLMRLCKIKNYESLCLAYYSGTVSIKNKNFLSDIDWRKEFKFEKPKLETIGEINRKTNGN